MFRHDAVPKGLMPALDFALGLRMIGCAVDVLHVAIVEPLRQVIGYVAGAVVGEQARRPSEKEYI